ncbi:SMC5-SMC6 complex localization factor protein 1-like isoform X2 [Patiria miniata]|uniref:BRCT domain-containing protein n=1 Tax=Patiria miniata TaxID=46514 RepID=A0A913ZPE2_PATMI|nr:SMC5-SMC6 complex localization factor protein 1-like isoform X2 [Patiria miniata]
MRRQETLVARRQSDRQQYRFLLSGFADHEKAALAESISRLGGKYLDSKTFVPDSTHVISVRPMRSEKYLCGCAAGKWIVTPDFVKASLAAGHWLEEEPYIWGNNEPSIVDERSASMASAPKRWLTHHRLTNQRAFTGWTVIILVTSNNNRPAVYKRLIECGGGTVLSLRPPIRDPDSLAKLLTHTFVDRCYEQKVRSLRDRGVPCLAPEFLAEFLFEKIPNQKKYDIATYKPETSSENSTPKGAGCVKTSQGHSGNHIIFTPVTATAAKASHRGKNRSQKLTLSQSSSESLVLTSSSQSSQSSAVTGSPLVGRARNQSKLTQSPLTQSTLTSGSVRSPGRTPWSRADSSAVNGDLVVKRKLKFSSTVVQETVAEVKRKQSAGHYSRVPFWMQVQPPKYQDDPVVAMAFPTVVSNLIEAYLEEDFWLKAVHSIHAHLSSKKYPPPSLMHVIMSKMLESTDVAYKNHAIHLLKSVLCLHRPTTPEMSSIYLQSFVPANDRWFGLESDDPINMPWDFIGSIIRKSLQRPQSEADRKDTEQSTTELAALRHSAELLLGYIVAVLEQDYQAFSYREENGIKRGKTRHCMLSQILWPSLNIKASSPIVRQLITFLLRAVSLVEETADMYPCLRMIITLVEIAAECCRMFAGDSSILGNLGSGAHQDLAVEIASMAMQDGLADKTESLNILLSLLHPDWLKLKVTESLFSAYHDSVVSDENRHMASELLSLKKVVNYYFYLIPPTAKRTLSSVTPEIADETTNPRKKARKDKPAAVPLKTLATSNHTDKNLHHSSQFYKKATKADNKVNRRNMRGETPLHVACIKNDLAKVRELLACPAIQVNLRDFAGWTALHEAANHGHVDCVRELLKYRPKQKITAYFTVGNGKKCQDSLDLVAAPTECGTTPLHDAVNNGHVEVVRLLVKAGGKAVLMARNKAGLAPLDVALDDPMKRALELDASKDSDSQKHYHSQPDTPSKRLSGGMQNALATEDVYTRVLGTIQDPKIFVTVEKCEQFCVLVCHLLQSCLRTHKLVSIKAGLDLHHQSTNGIKYANLGNTLPSLVQYKMVMSPSCSDACDFDSQSQGSQNPSDIGSPLMDDLTEMCNLRNHLAGFVHHLSRIGPWVGTERSNVCKKVLHDMTILIESCL